MPNARSARVFVVLAILLVGAAGAALRWGLPNDTSPVLRVGIGPWIGYEPFVAAREADAWPDSLRLVELGSTTETLDAFVEGRLDVIAEGVEEAADAAHLLALGCDDAQGYHYGKPMDEAALLDWARRAGQARG